MTGPDAPHRHVGPTQGKILACDKCATVATQSLIEQILSSLTNAAKVERLLTCTECMGHYKIMTRAYAAQLVISYFGEKLLKEKS